MQEDKTINYIHNNYYTIPDLAEGIFGNHRTQFVLVAMFVALRQQTCLPLSIGINTPAPAAHQPYNNILAISPSRYRCSG